MATQIHAAAARYAQSLYELASKEGGPVRVREVADELEQVCELARRDRRFAEFLGSPIVGAERRRDSLRRIFKDRVSDLLLRFLFVVNDNERLGEIEQISDAMEMTVQEAQGMIEVDVYTAAPIDASHLGAIGQRVKSALGREPVLHHYTDATMLGGIRLRIGDQLIDGSVSTQLRRMHHGLLTGGAETIRSRMNKILGEANP